MKIKRNIISSILLAAILGFTGLIFICYLQLKYNFIQNYIHAIGDRQEKRKNSIADKLFLRTAYHGMIIYGKFRYPEAAAILEEYLYGNNDSLELTSSYFKKAEYVKSDLKNVENGIIGPIFIKLKDDKRIAYALNGYYLKVNTNANIRNIEIYQDILFSANAHIMTSFGFGPVKIKMPDKLVYVVKRRSNDHLFVFTKWKDTIKIK